VKRERDREHFNEKVAALASVENTNETTRGRYGKDKSSIQSAVQCGLAMLVTRHDISIHIQRE
jgi:hypothetical protein